MKNALTVAVIGLATWFIGFLVLPPGSDLRLVVAFIGLAAAMGGLLYFVIVKYREFYVAMREKQSSKPD